MKNPVRVCVIGAGRVGRLHSASITRYVPGGRVVAIVDPVAEVLETTANEFGIEGRFASLEQALEKVDFEGVVVTTPTPMHKPITLLAAEHGKHVFLEKPMALSLPECDDMLAAARRNQVILQLGFMRRFDPEFMTAAKRIESGEIGQPMMIKTLTHGPGLPPPWARDLTTSNGNLAEVNSHDWDTIRWLMASDYERVYAEVANVKGRLHNIDTPGYYDNALVIVRLASGGLGMISSICPCDYGYDARVEIHGKYGIMLIGDLRGQAIVVCTNRDQGLVTPIYRTWPERFAWGYVHELEHFVQCIATGKEPRVGATEGRWAVAGVLAATRSFQEQRPVSLEEILSR